MVNALIRRSVSTLPGTNQRF
uniref:Uncharacterized protein n=1 Tax=Arundo donax TaxID=35708 RepID=A0A0A9AJI3_ARUDO